MTLVVQAKSIVALLNQALAAAEVQHEKAARAKHAAAAGFNLAAMPFVDADAEPSASTAADSAAVRAAPARIFLCPSLAYTSCVAVCGRVCVCVCSLLPVSVCVCVGLQQEWLLEQSTTKLAHLGFGAGQSSGAGRTNQTPRDDAPLAAASSQSKAQLPARTMWDEEGDSASVGEGGGAAATAGDGLRAMATHVIEHAVAAGQRSADAARAGGAGGGAGSGASTSAGGDVFALDSDEEDVTMVMRSGFEGEDTAAAASIYSVVHGDGGSQGVEAPVADLEQAVRPEADRRSAGQRRRARKKAGKQKKRSKP